MRVVVDPVEGLCDCSCRRRRLLPCVQRHDFHHERRGREPIDASTRTDDPPQRPRHQEPLRDPLRPREHQPLHAGPTLLFHCFITSCSKLLLFEGFSAILV